MKLLISLIMAFLSYSNNLKADNEGPLKPTPILRTAKAIVQINKTWYEKNDQGQYENKTEVLCERTLPNINVYEVGEGSEFLVPPSNSTTCETTYNNRKILITVVALLGEGIANKDFGNLVKPGTRVKLALSLVTVFDAIKTDSTFFQPIIFSKFLTEDLKLKTMMSFSTPTDQRYPTENTCDENSNCVEVPSKVPPFYFEALVKIEDDDV